MCDTCGCNITPGNRHLIIGEGKLARTEDGRTAVSVLQGLLSENDHQAAHNREHFDRRGILALNLMSSPGDRLPEKCLCIIPFPKRIITHIIKM